MDAEDFELAVIKRRDIFKEREDKVAYCQLINEIQLNQRELYFK